MIAAVYIAATLFWWTLFRRVKTFYVVSIPFAVYGLAFFFLGMALYAPSKAAREWVFNVATGLYAAASASGSLFFVLNFGTEGKQLHFTVLQNFEHGTLTTFLRWNTGSDLGIQGVCHPRHPADIRGISVVLGRHS